jgi:hypothetical protein
VKTTDAKQDETQSKSPSSRQPVIPAEIVEQATEEVEILHASIKLGAIAQVVVALVAIIGLLYLLKLVLVTILASILLAYVLEAPVALLVRWHFPRFWHCCHPWLAEPAPCIRAES